ncbi:MAG: site-2 protease family protein [Actinomycetia bacterium]|nr:site-2 protease family protein [Actinomycetes bacterium]
MLPSSGFKIGRVLGIDIVINFTWLLILFFVAISLGDLFRITYEETWVAGQPVTTYFPSGAWPWVAGAVTALVFFACLLLHELAHSLVAKRNGIGIRRITLFLFGGVAEMREDVSDAGVEFRMAAAGPLASFLLAGAFYGLYRLSNSLGAGLVIVVPLYYLAVINALVGAFNLLPGFPLDGGRVLRALLWKVTGDMRKATKAASISGRVIAALIAAVGAYAVLIGDYFGGFWLILIGGFIYGLSQASYRQTLFRLAASGTVVADIMYTDVPVVDARTTLSSLRDNYFAAYRLPAFPVAERGHAWGIVTREDMASVSPAEWDLLDVGRIARPLEPDQSVPPDTGLDKIVKPLLGNRPFLMVMDEGRVHGVITKEELLRYVEMRSKHLEGK